MADSSNPYKLNAEDHEKVYQRIQRKYLRKAEAQEQPKAVITGGQPGSGKSGLVDQAVGEFARRGGHVLIDADKLRPFHPRFREALEADDTTAANLTHPDAGAWASRLARDAIAARFNVIIDQTSRDPVTLKATAEGLNRAEYETDLRVMATREEVSWQRVHTRYWDQKEESGHGRFSTRDKHDEAYAGVAAAVEAAETGKFVRAIGVYDQEHRPLHRAELRNVEWTPGPGAAQAMHDERSRPLAAR